MALRQYFSVVFAVLLAFAVLVASLLWLDDSTRAQSSTLYVATDGNCGGMTPCYASIQAAVDAASNGDTIKVAQGTYTGSGFQVVYINKGITLTGGYTLTDWYYSYPITQPSVIDAEGVARRRGIYIDGSGMETITLNGLVVQRGYAYNASGGGIYIVTGTLIIRESQLLNNTATGDPFTGLGGGIYAENGNLVLSRNTFQGNSADQFGGGVNVARGTLSFKDNFFRQNRAPNGGGVVVREDVIKVVIDGNTFQEHSNVEVYHGGGVWIVSNGNIIVSNNIFQSNSTRNSGGGARIQSRGHIIVSGNTFRDNRTGWLGGGGLSIANSTFVTLSNNVFQNNSAEDGGGLNYQGGSIILSGNIFRSNTATRDGGGLYVGGTTVVMNSNILQSNSAGNFGGGLCVNNVSTAILSKNILQNNSADIAGGAMASSAYMIIAQNDVIADNISPWDSVYIYGGTLMAHHWTMVNNGSYALTTDGGMAVLTNTIVTSHTIGGFAGANITADHTLFFNSGTPCSSGASCTNNLFGNPQFINPITGDYHIGPGSAAVDQGINAGVATDIDDEPRPMRSGYDIGADEQPPAPTASFTSSGYGWVGQTILLTNTTAITGVVSYLWSFGDGTADVVFSPTHIYNMPGIYTITLTATNTGGSSVATGTVVIYTAAFTSSSPDWQGQTTLFTNTTVSSGTTTYLWSFGDGATDTLENPSHIYTNPGFYTVVLTATNFAGSGIATDTVCIYSLPDASFTHSSPDWVGQTTVFTATTITIPPDDPTLIYAWDFGDRFTSTFENPTHTYTLPGIYLTVLTVTNVAGNNVVTDNITIYGAPDLTLVTSNPDWQGQDTFFTATMTTIPFYDPSVSLEWNFGDGMSQSGTESVSHTYNLPNIYTVAVTATNHAGHNTTTDIIIIYGLPNADYTLSNPGWMGQATVFTNTSTGIPLSDSTITYLWSFGDGMTSTQTNPTYTYSQASLYTTVLTATNAAGSDVTTNTLTIYGSPTTHFTACPTVGFYPLAVTFSQTTTTTPLDDPTLGYFWSFGDGITSTLPNPAHVYSKAGQYTITLTVSNAAGNASLIRKSYIGVYEPVKAGASGYPREGVVPFTVYFTDTSSGPVTTWEWTFGDGGISTLQHPTHTYTAVGVYTVSLAVTTDAESAILPGGSDTVILTHYITVSPGGYRVYLPLVLRN